MAVCGSASGAAKDDTAKDDTRRKNGAGGHKEAAFVNRQGDARLSEDPNSVLCDEVGNAAVHEEASVINKGRDPAGDGATAGMVLDSDGDARADWAARRVDWRPTAYRREPKESPCLHPVDMWATSSPWQKRGDGPP